MGVNSTKQAKCYLLSSNLFSPSSEPQTLNPRPLAPGYFKCLWTAIFLIFVCLVWPSIAGAQGYIRRSVGIVIKNSGADEYHADELKACLKQVFSKSYTTYAKFIDTPGGYDRFSLQKAGEANNVSSVVLIDIKPGKTPWLFVRKIFSKNSKSQSRTYPLNNSWGGLCDTAFFATLESFIKPPSAEVTRALEQGDKQLQDGSRENALAWYRHAIDLDPDSPASPLKLARFYRDAGDTREALRWYSAALSNNPDDPWAYLEAANLAQDSGLEREAIQYYEFAINSGSGIPRIFKSVGALYYSQGQYALAVQSYSEALQLAPNDRAILPLLVSALNMEDRYSEAMEFHSRILAREKTVDNIRRMAYLAEEAGEYQKAADALGDWLSIDPDSYSVMRRLAAAWDKSGRIEEALDLWHELQREYPDDVTVARSIGRIYYKKKDYQKAIAILEEARIVDPADTEAVRLEAMAREFAGDAGGALALHVEALRRDNRIRSSDIARLLAFGEKYDCRYEVKSLLRAMLASKGLDDRRIIVMGLGEKYVEEGDVESAVRVYESAIGTLKQYVPAYLALGDLYLKLGQTEKATILFDDALISFSDSMIPLYAATRLHQAGEIEEAKRFYYSAHHRNSGNAGIAVALAEVILMTEKDWDSINHYFHVAQKGRLSAPLKERLFFLEILWGRLTGNEEFADGVLRYALGVIAESPNRRIDLAHWNKWISKQFQGKDQAFAQDLLALFEGGMSCDEFSKAHPKK
jgi:tetratricopeptide (TPR) repeat protein